MISMDIVLVIVIFSRNGIGPARPPMTKGNVAVVAVVREEHIIAEGDLETHVTPGGAFAAAMAVV